MALSLILLSGCMVDYVAKFSLLVCLGREPHLRGHFTALATAHIAANMHGTYAHCRSATRLPCSVTMVAVMLLFGVITPFMQAVHILDTIAAVWMSQDLGRRPALRPAPLDIILEGLAFACAALHLRVCLTLGRLEAPDNMSLLPLTFEALLALTLATSLVTTATGLVFWDSAVSIKLSRDMYGWPGRRGGGVRGGSIFFAHLAFRGSEVAGKSALLAVLAALLGPRCTVGYIVLSYIANLLVLLLVSHREAYTWHLREAAILAWPLLFANLPQFVDCPKHSAAAHSAAGLVCGLRALELAVAFSAVVATVLLEAELEDDLLGVGVLSGGSGDAAQAMRALGTLYHRSATAGWCLCLLAHYLCMTTRWCCPCSPAGAVSAAVRRAAAGGAAVGRGRLPAVGIGRRGGHPPTWPQPPEHGSAEEKEFWPPAASLAPLLLLAGCERSPVAWCFISPSASSSSAAGAAEQRLRVEDFETIRLIGRGEFGKVFQVRLRSTQEVFAMKRLSKEFYSQRRMTDKAIREIFTLSLARHHPFVVRLVYTIENSREWAMVMEYCPHGDLQQLLLNEGFPGLALSRTVRIAAEVALALEYLHTNGIVFRDLKLENVVLDREGHAKLTDFGLAKQHRGGQDAIAEAELAGGAYAAFARTFCGSYGYAAPEVNPRRQVHGFAADLYSFGVMLLMMIMGGEVYHDMREPPWERRLPPETPNDLQDIVSQLSFDFYWASHHFLQPARAGHRVEVNLNGSIVIVSRGPRVRRQARPHRPPNSPRASDLEPQGAVPLSHPVHFPTLACTSCEAVHRRWDLALDLVRVLTSEFPERRGTVAALKRHPFFAEEISDWRTVYPKSWLVDRLKDKLLALPSAGAAGGVLPQRVAHWLERLPLEELVSLQDDPDLTAEVLEEMCPGTSVERLPQDAPRPPIQPLVSTSGIASSRVTGASSSDSWCANYR
mmetsp:Transcript_114554/g.318996  ORF Transcript_114554/g.318996 Transcript_114554/m.318996 type:complete len:948 (+) Transcript_114554:157-3000(+)